MRKVKFKVVHVDYKGIKTSAYAQGSYSLCYSQGTIVRARRNTVGVAVFQTRRDAERFVSCFSGFRKLKIIRVRPVGRGKTVNIISHFTNPDTLASFYIRVHSVETRKPPPGTIFYPAVEVIE